MCRFFQQGQASNLVWDVEEVMSKYVQSSVPTIEFARTYGANGELIKAMKRNIAKHAYIYIIIIVIIIIIYYIYNI